MNNLQDIFSETNIGLVIKLFQLLLLILYVIFSFVTLKQVNLMNGTLYNPIRVEVKTGAYLQLFLGIGMFIIILLS